MQNAATPLDTARPSPRRLSTQARTIVATSAGNALEMFDFTVFSYFAGLIGKTFFPVDSSAGLCYWPWQPSASAS